MLIDEKGIFEQIKKFTLNKYQNACLFVYGSRVLGYSVRSTDKKDFDVIVSNISESEYIDLFRSLKNKFENEKDEFGKIIKIDLTYAKNVEIIKETIKYAISL